MLKTGTRMLMLMGMIAATSFVVAETTSSNIHTTQIEKRLAGVVPNTVIISVDEKGRIAKLSGTVSSQSEIERITEMVRGVPEVRIISSDLRLNQSGVTHSEVTNDPHETESASTDVDHSSTPDRSTVGDETIQTHTDMDHSTTEGSSLVTQIDGRFMDVSQDTVIVIVDESTNTAFVRGNVATQAQVDNVISTLSGMTGLRIAGTNFTADGRTVIGSGTVAGNVQQPKVSGGISGTAGDDDDDITTSASSAVPDATLRAAVEEALKSEGIMGQSKISIETENGVVTLTGAALSESQADRIVALAMAVPGVVRVQPNLTLRDQKRRYQVKPSKDRDKDGFPVDSGESRVPEDREGDVEVDVDVDNPDTEDDDDNEQ